MNLSASLLNQNNALAAMSQQAGTEVTKAIYSASHKSGVDFGYLLKQAKVESSFDTDAQAKTSSARGLYQFINSTWLDMVKKHGEKYGIDTSQSKQELLALRDDPEISAHMAAEFAGENQNYLERQWGGEVGATELYLAHFMGAGGASSFLKAKDANPLQPAAELFGRAAKANENVFFDRTTKRAKTLQEVYDYFDQKFEDVKGAETVIAETEKPSNSFLPLHTFTQRLDTLSRELSEKPQEMLSLFSNMPTNKQWIKVSSVDFVSLLKAI